MLRFLSILFFASMVSAGCYAQTDDTYEEPKFDFYQIYLKKPAKEIRELLYNKTCEPINGTLSKEKKTIIMQDYEPGNKVYVQIIYLDGTEEEFVRSPCYIDPVIL